MPSGVYFYRLSIVPSAQNVISTGSQAGQVGEILETRKMVLMK
jgi:hypothetical protein